MRLFLDQFFNGVGAGVVYASVALALVIIYRTTGLLNFAQGEMALFSTFLAWKLTQNTTANGGSVGGGGILYHGLGIVPALLLTIAISFVGGAVIERVLIRPVEGSKSPLNVVIVTLGMFLAICNVLAALIFVKDGQAASQIPLLFADGKTAGIQTATLGRAGILIAECLVLYVLLQRTKLGLSLRAVASSPESAKLVGINPGAMLMVGWAIAAAIGAVAGVLSASRGTGSFDPSLMQQVLVYSFAAAALGGFDSMLGAVVGGMIVGIANSLTIQYVKALEGIELVVPFALILIVLLVRPNGLLGRSVVERVTAPTAAAIPAIGSIVPKRAVPWVRIVVGIVVAVVAIGLPYNYAPETNQIFCQVLYLAVAAMGLNLLTGFNGQVSIGHGAFFGIGAFTSAILVVNHGWQIEATIPIAALVAAAVGVMVGIPALRVKGLYLALVTLGMAVLFPNVVKKYVRGPGGIPLLRPTPKQVSSLFAGVPNDIYRYDLCLLVLVITFLLAHNLMRSRVGRAIIAVRDQEVAASTVGVDVARVKVITFALSAAYAGVAGSLSVVIDRSADASNPLIYFQRSIEFLIAVVIGGAATITGPLLGAMLLVLIKKKTEDTEALAPALLGGALILVVYVLPDGLVGGYRRIAARVQGRRRGATAPSEPNQPEPSSTIQGDSP